jgi:ABC-2 type transport system permease protein
MWERIRVIIRKELIQTLREPRMRILLFMPPMIQLLVFGFAVNLDVDHARIAWMDMDRSPLSRDLRARFEGSGRFDVVSMPRNENDVQQTLDRGLAQAVVRVLPGFERDVERGRATEVQVLLDGTNSNTASLISSYAGGIIAEFSGDVMAGQQKVRVLTRSPNSPVALTFPSVKADTRVWFNPDLRSRNYFVPGVVANIIMIVTLMLTALAIVREKEIGTMEQLMVTPIRPIELMLGKTLPFAVVGLLDVVLVSSVALLVFHIPFRGSVLLLLFCASLFLMTTLGAGLFLSTISQTQQQAMMMNFFFSTPAFMLSGFAFPIRNMPVAVQYLTYLNPLRYFMEVVRGIFLKGVGISVLWPQMVAMAVYGVLVLGLSAARFQKTLD